MPTPVVGVFDSGVGGLSIWLALRRTLPGVPLLYLADTAWFPYGPRAPGEVATRVQAVAAALVELGATLVVDACCSVGSAVLADLRASTGVQVVGTVPAIKPATLATRTGHVAALVTPMTAAAPGYTALLAAAPPDIRVWTCPCPNLAEQVERGDLDGPLTRAQLHRALGEPLAAGADAVVLGCTHYAFLAPTIHALAGHHLGLYCSADGVARQAARLLSAPPASGTDRTPAIANACYTTGPAESFAAAAHRLLGGGSNALGPIRQLVTPALR